MDTSLRILHVDSGRRPGGGQRQVAALIAGLAERGHASLLACPQESPIRARLAQSGSGSANVETAALPLSGSWDLRSAWKLKKLAAKSDLIHTHDARSHSLARLAATLGMQTPLVVHRRVAFPVRASLLRSWKYLRGVGAYIAVSPAVRDELTAAGVMGEFVHVVQSCIPSQRLELLGKPLSAEEKSALQQEIGLPEDVPVILNVGRLTKEKGHNTLVEATARLHAQDTDAVLVFVGEGPLRGELERLGKQKLPRNRFRLLGAREDIPKLLSLSSLFVLASSREGFPVALFEAMAAGVPVVGTACGGAETILTEGQTGRVVPPGDAKRMAQAMLEALSLEKQSAQMAQKAKTLVALRLSAKEMVDGVLGVYRQVLERNGS